MLYEVVLVGSDGSIGIHHHQTQDQVIQLVNNVIFLGHEAATVHIIQEQ